MSTAASVERVTAAVAEVTGISADVLRGRCRTRRVSRARAVLCYVAYQYERCTLTSIAASLGGRDHTTILWNQDSADRHPDFSVVIRSVLTVLARPAETVTGAHT